MKLRTVKDLKTYLARNSMSPERFAALCEISNMTVRRWVKKNDTLALPAKYWILFDQALNKSPTQNYSFDHGFSDLEKHVHDLGITAHSPEMLEIEFVQKLNEANIAQGLIEKVKFLFRALLSPRISHYQRCLVLGAITYFISPLDLIPDVTPVIGYLDDYAVVSMVIASVAPALTRKPGEVTAEPTKDSISET